MSRSIHCGQLAVLFLAGCTATGGSQSDGGSPLPIGPDGGWQLVFNDEFDDAPGMSGAAHGLSTAKWNSGWYTNGIDATSPPVQAEEAEWYGPEGIVFPGDGACHLRLFSNHSSVYGKDYESGCITTAGHFDFAASQKRSVVEARIRVPGPLAQSAGYWPAFWLLSHENAYGGTAQWPPEIDIFEFFSNSNDPVAHLHTTGTDINQGFSDSDSSIDLSLAYHVYTLDLSTSALIFYLDGVERWRYTDAGNIANLLAYDPMYVLINFQFGGYAGDPTGTVPNDMLIDYLRIWQCSPCGQ